MMPALTFRDRICRLLWRLLPKRTLSGAIGLLSRAPLPRPVRRPLLGMFARSYGINLREAEKPLNEYASVHDLFVRRLGRAARPVPSDPAVVCAPADGHIVETGVADPSRVMVAKGHAFTLAELLADRELAHALAGGPYHITYLSPGDYHRVHAPIAGRIVGWRHVPGRLFSVSAPTLRREAGLFAKNERVAIVLDGGGLGPCACVLVAAFGVGNITLACDPEVETHHRGGARAKRLVVPPAVERGAELGTFHLGSTVVTVFSPGRVELDPVCSGVPVRVGQGIGRGLAVEPKAAGAALP